MFNLDEVFKLECSFELDKEIEFPKPEKESELQKFSSGYKPEVTLGTLQRELMYGYQRPNISSVFVRDEILLSMYHIKKPYGSKKARPLF